MAAGYFTPLVKKLGFAPDMSVVLLHAPLLQLLGEIPSGIKVSRRLTGSVDVVLIFTQYAAELSTRCWP